MKELKKVAYKGFCKNKFFDIWTWEGTPLSVVWNEQKRWFLPGDIVIIGDGRGHSEKFIKGLF